MTFTQPTETEQSSRPKRYPPGVSDALWAPLVAAFLMLIAGLCGLLAHQPWLFPSLGPTAFLQAEQPEQSSARFYNTVMGHLNGLITGIIAVLVLGAAAAPPVLSSGELTPVRVWAAVLAVALNLLFGFILKASHPPAAATTLLVALGGFKPTWHDGATIMIGVVITAIAGEALRQYRLKGKLR